jgi:hypothetical protein
MPSLRLFLPAVLFLCALAGCASQSGMSRDEVRVYIDEANAVSPADKEKRERLSSGAVQATVEKFELEGEKIRVRVALRNTFDLPVSGVALHTMVWSRSGGQFARRIVDERRLDLDLPPAGETSTTIESLAPTWMPSPIEFVTVATKPIRLGDEVVAGDRPFADSDGDDISADLAALYLSQPGIGLADIAGRSFGRLFVQVGDISSDGRVVKIRAKVANLYTEEVTGVHYRVTFLSRRDADARVLDTLRLESSRIRIAAGERKLIHLQVQSMYALGGGGFFVDAWPMVLGNREIPLPEGW